MKSTALLSAGIASIVSVVATLAVIWLALPALAAAEPRHLEADVIRLVGSDGTPTVYSYALNDAEVPAKGQAKIADAPIAAWLDTKSVKSWVEYAVRGDDEGVASARRQWACSADAASATLAIGSLAPFTDVAGTARIVIDVKSKYFSSRGDSEEVKTITLTHDNETQNVAIFLIGRSAEDLNRTGDPLFTYRYRVIRSDGIKTSPAKEQIFHHRGHRGKTKGPRFFGKSKKDSLSLCSFSVSSVVQDPARARNSRARAL